MLSASRIPLSLILFAGASASYGELAPFHTIIDQAKSENKPIVVVWNGSDWSKTARDVTKIVDNESSRSKLPVIWAVEDDKDSMTEEESAAKKNKMPSLMAWNIPAIQVFTPNNEVIASFENIAPADTAKILASIPKILDAEKNAQAIWKQAEEKSGVDAARLYDKGLALLPSVARANRKSILEKIKKLDPEDKEGIAFKNNFNHLPYIEKLNSLCNDKKWDEAEQFLKAKLAIKGMSPNERQKVMAGSFLLARQKGEKEQALQALLAIVKVAPDSEMGRGAKNYHDYLTKPVILKGRKITSWDMRPEFMPMIAEVGDVVKGSGTYKIEFKFTSGGASIRNPKFMSGNKVLAELPSGEQNNERRDFTLELTKSPGSKVQLVVESRGHGWFDADGEIIITKQ